MSSSADKLHKLLPVYTKLFKNSVYRPCLEGLFPPVWYHCSPTSLGVVPLSVRAFAFSLKLNASQFLKSFLNLSVSEVSRVFKFLSGYGEISSEDFRALKPFRNGLAQLFVELQHCKQGILKNHGKLFKAVYLCYELREVWTGDEPSSLLLRLKQDGELFNGLPHVDNYKPLAEVGS